MNQIEKSFLITLVSVGSLGIVISYIWLLAWLADEGKRVLLAIFGFIGAFVLFWALAYASLMP